MMRYWAAFLLLSTAGCGPAYLGAATPERGTCREPPGVRWVVPDNAVQQDVLAGWCAAVGPAVYHTIEPLLGAPASASGGSTAVATPALDADALPVVDSLLVVTWNAHVGGGALDAFVRDLRAGRLTAGDSVEHFVLLLQEVFRGSDAVPPLAAGMLYPGLIEEIPPAGERTDIEDWVARHPDLALFYAPSMRNGEATMGGAREDRGSAIVATLPLLAPTAYEMPVQRQRRVVPVALVAARLSDGAEWRMQVASVHLENNPAGAKNPERARYEQIEWLLDALPDEDNAVLGGDMNTWMRGPGEIVIWRTRERYPDTPFTLPSGPTYERARVVRMYLDYLFFRVPDGGTSGYRRIPTSYGSDHYPLLAWVHFR
jgi:endonuclease/exonuclease/phosphatase family metal-dependent hydrolase